jgi:hypothetical protein
MQPAPWAVPNTRQANSPIASRPPPTLSPPQPALPPDLVVHMELNRRHSTLLNRANQAKNQLLLMERAPAGKATPVPQEVRASRDNMDAQFRAALDAMIKRDAVKATQSLNAGEANLAAIEKFLAK